MFQLGYLETPGLLASMLFSLGKVYFFPGLASGLCPGLETDPHPAASAEMLGL